MRKSLRFIVCSFFALLSLSLFAQQSRKVDITFTNGTLIDFIRLIEKQSDYTFIFNSTINLDQIINVNAHQENIQTILDNAFKGKEINYEILGKQIVLKSLTAELKQENGQQNEKLIISGRVFDTNGVPMPGVTILVSGTKNVTTSNMNGEYTISDVAPGASVEYSFVGFKTQLINVLGRTKIDVILSDDITTLEEAVVVGYGAAKKISSIVGAATTVKSKVFSNIPAASAGDALQGQVAGLQVYSSTGEPCKQEQEVQ